MNRLKQLAFPAILGVALYFAVFGGEHTWFDLREARQEIELQSDALAELRREIDSLRARVDSLETDRATLERVARERFGMIRDGEILYRFAEPVDSASPEEEDEENEEAR